MSKWINKTNLQKIKSMTGRYSLRELLDKILEKCLAPYRDYCGNYHEYLPSAEEIKRQKSQDLQGPKISIVVPAYETDELFLKQMIDSVVSQTYDNWQLCIADGSVSRRVESVIQDCYAEEKRISYLRLDENKGISENTNAGFKMAEGTYIGLLDHDDLLVETALFEMVRCIEETGAELLYSDEDKVTADLSAFMDPHLKPDFNPELLRGNNYICHFLVFSRALLEKTGGMQSQFNGAQDFDFVLRCSEAAGKIEHVSKVLYHWRIHPGSTSGNAESKLYAYEAGRRAIEAHLERMRWQGKVTMQKDYGFYETIYEPPRGKNVKLILWGKETSHFSNVQEQIQDELKKLDCRIVSPKAGNADYILIISRELKHIVPGSVRILLGSCAREGIGIAGAKTTARKRVVQCGYQRTDKGYVPLERGLHARFKGYFRHAVLARNVDAVTNIFAAVKPEFQSKLQMKGHEENGMGHWVLVCEEAARRGHQIVIEPRAEGSLT